MGAERLGSRLAIGGALVGIAVFAVCAVVSGAAWRAWLGAAVLCAGAPTGALVIAMMVRLIPGAWREGLAEPLSIAPVLLPLAAVAMIPVLLAPGHLYGWTRDPGPGAFRDAYLSPLAFAGRGLAWFVVLIVLALWLARARAGMAAVIGLLIVAPGSLPIATDWLMSLDPGFASSGFGLYVLAVEVALALALAIAFAARPDTSERTLDVLGGVLFTVLTLWAYLGFMQYFITWSNDLAAPARWYLRRGHPWQWLAWAAVTLKGGGGLLLMSNHIRRDSRWLRRLCLAIAAGAAPEMAWLVLPASGPSAGPLAMALFVLAVAALETASLGLFLVGRERRRTAA